jgi:hypothetical protein
MTADAVLESDAVALLHALNARFIRALGESDLDWLGARLGDDFACTLRDGRRARKAAFLNEAPVACRSGVCCDEVDVHVLGGVALVHGVMHHTHAGELELTRYTAVWQDAPDLGWVAIAADFTPVCAAASRDFSGARRGPRVAGRFRRPRVR